jgi:hypothetical protein
LLDCNFAIELEDRVLLVNKIFNKIKGKNAKTKHLIKENWSLIYTIFKRDKNDFKTQVTLPGFKYILYLY